MTKPEETITFESTINTLKVNLDRTGFYRVYYENMENLDIKSFNQYEAWGLINDYFYFYLSSKIKYKDYEYILSQLLTRREPLIVLGISDQLSLLWSINREKYGRLSIDYHSTQLKYYTIRNTDIEKKVYGILAERLARFDDKFSLGLSELFNSFHEIDPNMKDASAIAYAIAYEDEAYDVLLDKYRRERYDEDKLIILKGMLWFRKPELVINTLSLALTREIKRQDVARLLPIVAHNPFSRKAVWKWIKTNIEFLRGLYKGVGTLGRVLEASIPLLGIESPDVESFFISYNIPEAIIGIKSGLEVLKAYKRIF
jgi:tricorn protease interacting factor F2/3